MRRVRLIVAGLQGTSAIRCSSESFEELIVNACPDNNSACLLSVRSVERHLYAVMLSKLRLCARKSNKEPGRAELK